MDLSIITVTHQSKENIDTCILSLRAHIISLAFEHIIIDNGSSDGTKELIKESYSTYVKLIENTKNIGFAAACNQGLSFATGRYILFLNPDMQIFNGYIDDLIKWADTKAGLGIASCKLITSGKRTHHALRPITFPTLLPYFLSLMGFKPFFCTVHPNFFYPIFDDDKEQEVDVVRGAFMLIKKDVLQDLGFAFDPRYFLLLEDVDLCRHMQKMHRKVLYTPRITCIDYFGCSFNKKTSIFKCLHFTRSLCTYVAKWHSRLHILWIIPLAAIGMFRKLVQKALKLYVEKIKTSN